MKTFLWLSLVLMLTLVACNPVATEIAPTSTPAGKVFEPSLYAGTYTGTWTNSATGASGPASITIDLDEETQTAALSIDFGGNYLGLNDPPAAELSGTFDANGAVVKGSSILFGDYDVTIDPDGNIIGVMKNLAGGVIPEMTYTGTVTGSSLDADYLVKFADGTTANSILQMQK